MQRKLDSFFKITTAYNESTKNCFIYDPENRSAYFAYKPDQTDKYISTKCRVKLFYRQPASPCPSPVFIPTIATKLNVPVLKSNLQKAIRRHRVDIALTTTIALLQKDPTEFLRRLPIIYIEDVCLCDSYPIITWFMMTDKEYSLTNQDIAIILSIVKDLCDVSAYYMYDSNDDCSEIAFDLSHESLQQFDHKDCLLALYYRHLYGGTKGDMQMIQNSIYYYAKNQSEIHGTTHTTLDLTVLNQQVDIIEEAIDFHPLPHMLGEIRKRIRSERGIYITDQIIKMHIWFAESGVNFRKPHTMTAAEEHKHTETWDLVKPPLDEFRKLFIAMNC
jgi:hypothetical protein